MLLCAIDNSTKVEINFNTRSILMFVVFKMYKNNEVIPCALFQLITFEVIVVSMYNNYHLYLFKPSTFTSIF